MSATPVNPLELEDIIVKVCAGVVEATQSPDLSHRINETGRLVGEAVQEVNAHLYKEVMGLASEARRSKLADETLKNRPDSFQHNFKCGVDEYYDEILAAAQRKYGEKDE